MIDENIVYVKIKNGIFKCYKSEQMHKPIYYPVESKTNGYIDYNDVIDTLSADDLYNELKKQKEVIDKAINAIDLVIELIKQQPTKDDRWILDRLNGFKIILEDKGVSE